jgi:hypothetical protein
LQALIGSAHASISLHERVNVRSGPSDPSCVAFEGLYEGSYDGPAGVSLGWTIPAGGAASYTLDGSFIPLSIAKKYVTVESGCMGPASAPLFPLVDPTSVSASYDPRTGSISGTRTERSHGWTRTLTWNFHSGHHYVIDIRAWIPQVAVVDPLQPSPESYAFRNSGLPNLMSDLDPDCYTPSIRYAGTTVVVSTFRGDGHARFGEPYRLRAVAEFDFDGKRISNFRLVPGIPHAGATVRDKVYYNRTMKQVLAKCFATATAANRSAGQQTGATTFSLQYTGGNPLVPFALPISNIVKGVVNANGSIDLTFTATQFPTNGVQMTMDGKPMLELYETDVSCLSDAEVQTTHAVITLLWGLGHYYSAQVHAEPGQPLVRTHRSPVCP